ncbi:MAG: Hpt domain-containing protein [candidate division KSB1 bacterium]|nr:Hpt domain-containing protein [candidate division KSB1 bacterium]
MDFAAEFIQSFLEEAQESIELLDRELVHLEETPDDKTILDEIFRVFHTLKGNAGMLGFQRLEKVAHVTEEVLTEIRNGKRHIDEDLITFLLEATDLLKEFLIIIEADGSDAEGPTKLPSPLASIASEAAQLQNPNNLKSKQLHELRREVMPKWTSPKTKVSLARTPNTTSIRYQPNSLRILFQRQRLIKAPFPGEESPAFGCQTTSWRTRTHVDRNAHRLKADSAIRGVDVTLMRQP